MKIIGFMGFAGSGKDTAAQVLLADGQKWEKMAFADTLKDVLSVVFSWDRELLNGTTPGSREWRQTVDVWWAKKLQLPNFTPRLAMTMWGTDVLRKYINDDLWVFALEKKIANCHRNIVITDCRYANEAKLIRSLSGTLIHITKGPEPDFYQYSKVTKCMPNYLECQQIMKTQYCEIHSSEWDWNNIPIDYVIDNNSTVQDLHQKVENVVKL